MNRDKGFMAVVRRECRRMLSRRIYIFATLLFPLFALFFMTTIFGDGMINQLSIGIVDDDNTTLSRSIVRNLSAVPKLKVAKVYANASEAYKDMVSKKIYGYIHIPADFQSKIEKDNDVAIPYYYHYALLSVGSEVMQGMLSFLQFVAIAPLHAQTEQLGISDKIMEAIASPVVIESHPLRNPSLNYAVYLTFPYFSVLFQILILLTVAYTIGIEYKQKTDKQWLSTAGQNMFTALLGKLFPYTLIFWLVGLFSNIVIFQWIKIPLATDLFSITIATMLFVLATESIAVFLFGIYPKLPIIISFVSMFGSLGATMAGVTFPTIAMYPIFEKMAFLFPMHHYIKITQYLRYETWGFAYYWESYIWMLAFLFLMLLTIPKLKRKIIR